MYPPIKVNGKNDLAFRISSKRLSKDEAKNLYDHVKNNFNELWKDNTFESDPEKGKWVRNAKGTELGKVHKLIDKRILTDYDDHLPFFIHGGISGRSNITAAYSLLGYNKQRTVLSLDIERFFENVTEESITNFFRKSQCSTRGASILSKLTCVPLGKKGSKNEEKSLGRGFATSSRLAIWANIRSFYDIYNHTMKKLRDHDPRLVVYVDDIGISASHISDSELLSLVQDVDSILQKSSDGKIKLNTQKTEIMPYHKGAMHYLGLKLNRSSIGFIPEMQSKFDSLRHRRKYQSQSIKETLGGYRRYKSGIDKVNKEGWKN